MDRNKAHNKWKGLGHSAATTSLMLLSARSKQTKQMFFKFLEFALFKNGGHKQYKVTQEFFQKKKHFG